MSLLKKIYLFFSPSTECKRKETIKGNLGAKMGLIWQAHDEWGGRISVLYFPNTAWGSYNFVSSWGTNAVLGKPRLFCKWRKRTHWGHICHFPHHLPETECTCLMHSDQMVLQLSIETLSSHAWLAQVFQYDRGVKSPHKINLNLPGGLWGMWEEVSGHLN